MYCFYLRIVKSWNIWEFCEFYSILEEFHSEDFKRDTVVQVSDVAHRSLVYYSFWRLSYTIRTNWNDAKPNYYSNRYSLVWFFLDRMYDCSLDFLRENVLLKMIIFYRQFYSQNPNTE